VDEKKMKRRGRNQEQKISPLSERNFFTGNLTAAVPEDVAAL
jgi:hypothetical protein